MELWFTNHTWANAILIGYMELCLSFDACWTPFGNTPALPSTFLNALVYHGHMGSSPFPEASTHLKYFFL